MQIACRFNSRQLKLHTVCDSFVDITTYALYILLVWDAFERLLWIVQLKPIAVVTIVERKPTEAANSGLTIVEKSLFVWDLQPLGFRLRTEGGFCNVRPLEAPKVAVSMLFSKNEKNTSPEKLRTFFLKTKKQPQFLDYPTFKRPLITALGFCFLLRRRSWGLPWSWSNRAMTWYGHRERRRRLGFSWRELGKSLSWGKNQEKRLFQVFFGHFFVFLF